MPGHRGIADGEQQQNEHHHRGRQRNPHAVAEQHGQRIAAGDRGQRRGGGHDEEGDSRHAQRVAAKLIGRAGARRSLSHDGLPDRWPPKHLGCRNFPVGRTSRPAPAIYRASALTAGPGAVFIRRRTIGEIVRDRKMPSAIGPEASGHAREFRPISPPVRAQPLGPDINRAVTGWHRTATKAPDRDCRRFSLAKASQRAVRSAVKSKRADGSGKGSRTEAPSVFRRAEISLSGGPPAGPDRMWAEALLSFS